MRKIDSETWKDTYMEKLRESKRTGIPLSEICNADPVWMESHLQDLKTQHSIAVQEMIAAVDRVNDLKCQIWAIECERDKNKEGD